MRTEKPTYCRICEPTCGMVAREQRRLRRFVALVAAVRRAVPPQLRPGPAAVLIKRRSRRRWDAPPAPIPSAA